MDEFVGFGSGGIDLWYAAIQYQPEESVEYINGVSYFGSNDTGETPVLRSVRIYGSSELSSPQVLLWDNDDSPSSDNGWVEVLIEDEQDWVDAQEYDYYWIVIRSYSETTNWTGLGVDEGPAVDNGGSYKNGDDGSWIPLTSNWDYNYLIECRIQRFEGSF
jgi:hypothetical protein